ncbi:hypothetical protein DM02DRAFT_629620 [Periconia macrospinosa]|uniref:Uncharacterized protein n=1 Tax=Periconia macrospinosa TaxID=97972 RepID=A0A2V1DMJ4_9PLEO|nr:hypothetical protein DM02DRAFT_629620 [Periconia macrospinosa]
MAALYQIRQALQAMVTKWESRGRKVRRIAFSVRFKGSRQAMTEMEEEVGLVRGPVGLGRNWIPARIQVSPRMQPQDPWGRMARKGRGDGAQSKGNQLINPSISPSIHPSSIHPPIHQSIDRGSSQIDIGQFASEAPCHWPCRYVPKVAMTMTMIWDAARRGIGQGRTGYETTPTKRRGFLSLFAAQSQRRLHGWNGLNAWLGLSKYGGQAGHGWLSREREPSRLQADVGDGRGWLCERSSGVHADRPEAERGVGVVMYLIRYDGYLDDCTSRCILGEMVNNKYTMCRLMWMEEDGENPELQLQAEWGTGTGTGTGQADS